MPVYASQFGAVQTAYVSYKQYDLSTFPAPPAILQLVWPTSYQDSPNVVAAYMELINTPVAPPFFVINLPDATQVSVGQNFIISNQGTQNVVLQDFTGGQPLNVVPDEKFYVILTDNSTPAGVWHNVLFGVGSGTVTPGDIAGYGLNAQALPDFTASVLNTEVEINEQPPGTLEYDVQITDYAKMIVWNSGTGGVVLPAVNITPPYSQYVVPPAYYVSVNNAGGGQLTITSSVPADNIQGGPNVVLLPGETVTLIAIDPPINTGSISVPILNKWFTLGKTNLGLKEFTTNPITATNTDVTLTLAESNANIQVISGTLAADVTVFFANITSQWWVENNTVSNNLGSFNLFVGVSGFGTTIPVPSGGRQLFYNVFETPGIKNMALPDESLVINRTTLTNVSPVMISVQNSFYSIQEFVGTLGADVVVTFPRITVGQWTVVNKTVPGTFKLKVNIDQAAMLAAIELAPYSTYILYSDGTNIHVVSSSIGNLAQPLAPTAGKATLLGGTKTVSSGACIPSSVVLLTGTHDGAPPPATVVNVTSVSAGQFIIKSSDATDTTDVYWMIVNPVGV